MAPHAPQPQMPQWWVLPPVNVSGQQPGSALVKRPMGDWLLDGLNRLGLAYWVEITTTAPDCTYFFGPFASQRLAQAHWPGFVDDLMHEGAEGISVEIRRVRPRQLTISRD